MLLGPFHGITIAKKGLMTHQAAQNVVAHNIANESTPGFSRQRAVIVADAPLSFPALNGVVSQGFIGTGVTVQTIQQVRDEFIEARLNDEKQGLKQWERLEEVLKQIEVIFSPLEGEDLNTLLSDFFGAWEELSLSPESLAFRTNVVSTGSKVTSKINDMYGRLVEIQRDLNTTIEQKVAEINRLTVQIARLNKSIRDIESSGHAANDLRDERERLIGELSELVDVSSREAKFGQKTVYLNEIAIVQNDTALELTTAPTLKNDKIVEIRVAESNVVAPVRGGEVFGLQIARDTVVPFYLEKLNELARQLMIEVNALHSTGFGLNDNQGSPTTGYTFFEADELLTKNTNVQTAVFSARVVGSQALPEGTTRNTTLDQLGVTAGNFDIVFGTGTTLTTQTFTLTAAEVAAGTAISLAQLLDRISNVPGLSADFDTETRTVRITATNARTLVVQNNTTNFVAPAVTGLLTAGEGSQLATGDLAAHATVFSDDVAARIRINGRVAADHTRVATSTTAGGVPGNGQRALDIANLQSAKTMGDPKGETYENFFASVVTRVGLDTQEAIRQVNNFTLHVETLTNRREEISGVSIDEELINMERFQKAYNASARLFQTLTEMVDVLLNIGA